MFHIFSTGILRLDLVARPLLSRLPSIRFFVPHELLRSGIPFEIAAKADCNVGKVAGGEGSMMRINIGDGQPTISTALHKIPHMVIKPLSFTKFDENVLSDGCFSKGLYGSAGQFSAVDEEPALVSLEHDAIVKSQIRSIIFDQHLNTICEPTSNGEAGCRIE